MKVAATVLALVVAAELVLGVPGGYGPPQPIPFPQKYRPPNGPAIPAKFPHHHPGGGQFGKNEFHSKFNPHSLPPGVRGPPPPQFGKFPPPPPNKQQLQKFHHQQQQQQQYQPQQHQQQQQQQQSVNFPNFKPLGPQFQSKPHLIPNGNGPSPGQYGGAGQEQRVHEQRVPPQQRPSPKITNVWTGPKLSGPPDFSPRFPPVPVTIAPVAPITQQVPFVEKARPSYIINSDDERGPIKTIPAPNLNPSDRPSNFDEQLFRNQHQQSYHQPLDNTITDDKLASYQVTGVRKRFK